MGHYVVNAEHALVLLIKEILSLVSEIALLRHQGYSPRISEAVFQELCSVVHNLDSDLQNRYLELLPVLTAETPPRRERIISEEYVEAVLPARQRLVCEIREKLCSRDVA